MPAQFREPGRAEQLEVAAYEALIDAEYTETRRRGREYEGGPLALPTGELLPLRQPDWGQPNLGDYWPAAAAQPAETPAHEPAGSNA